MGLSFALYRHSLLDELKPQAWMQANNGLPTDQIIIVRYCDLLENDWICYKDFEWYHAELNGKKVNPDKINKITHYSYLPKA